MDITSAKPTSPTNLAFEDMGDQVVVYEPSTKQAHALTLSAVGILLMCDGLNTVDEIISAYAESTQHRLGTSKETIESLLHEFEVNSLILTPDKS